MERYMNRKIDRGSLLSKIFLLAFLAIIHPGTLNGVTGNGQVVEGERWKDGIIQSSSPPPLFPSRVKNESQTEEGSDSSSEETDEQNCTRLYQTDAKPSSSAGSRIQINLLNLLSQGSSYMVHDPSVKDATLIVGNTGCGKTTLSQMIAGDLTRLHAVRTESRRLLIIDDDNRIGVPSTISKTLVPELIRKREEDGNVTVFYDCPGFDDTRGPEEDIAANYFMNQIVRKVARVKILFLVIQSSVTKGNERLDFDSLATHATRFLKNITNYRKSIGLVVTKVPTFDEQGKPRKDKHIMKGVTEFLQMYLTDLHSQSNSSRPSPIPEDDVGRKIEFVSVLLEQNGRNKYGRISFSKSPIKCGPLSESPVVSDTRNRILSFYSTGLDYSPANPKDFGYTLKADSKLKLITYVEALNGNVTTETGALMEDFKATFDQQLSLSNDLIIKLKMVRNATATLTEIDTSSINLGNSSNPEAFLQILHSPLKQIGYEISPNFTHFMEYQQSIFDFFDEANAQPINRNLMSWLSPVKAVNSEYAKLEEEAKLALREFAASQNKEISNEISTLMGRFEEWLTAQHFSGTDQLKKAKDLENSATALGKLVVSLKTLGSKSHPTDFLSILKASLNGFGYNISIDLEEFMKLRESYFRYDDEVNPPGVIRTVNDWKEPILKLRTTLKGQDEKLKKDLGNQVDSLNVKMEQGISSLLTEFKVWYADKHLKTTNLSQITKELRNTNPTRIIKGLVTALNSSEAVGSSEVFLRRLRSTLEGMGYIVPPTVEAIERERQRHLDLFKELASPPTVNSNFDKWIELVEKVKEQFEDLLKWYSFCEGLETTMGTYAWQSNKPTFPKTKVDWLDFLGWGCPGCGIQVGSEIQLIKAKLARAQEDVLERIMEFALKPVEIKCDRENVTVTGNYVRLSEFISGRPLVKGCYSDFGQLEVYAAHTLFIDRDVEAAGIGLNLVIIAPNWVVVENRQIILSGADATGHNPEVAGSGKQGDHCPHYPKLILPFFLPINFDDQIPVQGRGGPGGDGLTGKPGGPGGSFFGLARQTKGMGELKITLSGGTGGDGQQGGTGGTGGTTRNAQESDTTQQKSNFRVTVILYTQHDDFYSHPGFLGFTGGSGGNGGAPGGGGNPGQFNYYMGGATPKIVAGSGEPGKAGRSGVGGPGGLRSMGMECKNIVRWVLFVPINDWSCHGKRFNYDRGQMGAPGFGGTSAAGLVTPAPPRQINKRQSISSYKHACGSLANSETKAFLRFLETNPTIRSFSN